jgi:hypothetical protein
MAYCWVASGNLWLGGWRSRISATPPSATPPAIHAPLRLTDVHRSRGKTPQRALSAPPGARHSDGIAPVIGVCAGPVNQGDPITLELWARATVASQGLGPFPADGYPAAAVRDRRTWILRLGPRFASSRATGLAAWNCTPSAQSLTLKSPQADGSHGSAFASRITFRAGYGRIFWNACRRPGDGFA